VVFLATIPPQRPGGFRAYTPTLVEPLNDRIRALAPQEGAVLVDVYRDFNGDVGLLQADGLHPNVAGYQRMAESFVAAIRKTLEVVPPPSSFGPSGLPALLSLAPAATRRVGQAHR